MLVTSKFSNIISTELEAQSSEAPTSSNKSPIKIRFPIFQRAHKREHLTSPLIDLTDDLQKKSLPTQSPVERFKNFSGVSNFFEWAEDNKRPPNKPKTAKKGAKSQNVDIQNVFKAIQAVQKRAVEKAIKRETIRPEKKGISTKLVKKTVSGKAKLDRKEFSKSPINFLDSFFMERQMSIKRYYDLRRNRLYDCNNRLSCRVCHSVKHNSKRCDSPVLENLCLLCGKENYIRSKKRDYQMILCVECDIFEKTAMKKPFVKICLFCGNKPHDSSEKCQLNDVKNVKNAMKCIQCEEIGHLSCHYYTVTNSLFCCNCGGKGHSFESCKESKMSMRVINDGLACRRLMPHKRNAMYRNANLRRN